MNEMLMILDLEKFQFDFLVAIYRSLVKNNPKKLDKTF